MAGGAPKARKDARRAEAPQSPHRLIRRLDARRDHFRGGAPAAGRSAVLVYGDYLCPYCQRLKSVVERLRKTLGDRMTYAYRHFPNERIHPGAEFAARAAEAAGRQGRFWEMHDALYEHPRPLTEAAILEIAGSLGLDGARFRKDLDDKRLAAHVADDLGDGRRNGVTGTPTIFIDGVRYDGPWDFYSMLEALDRPVGARVNRAARAFANLPTSAGLVVLASAAAALICANSPLAGLYGRFIGVELGAGPRPGGVWMSLADWCSQGLLAVFFLILGLEIRREMTAGALSDRRAALGPIIAAVGGVVASGAIYLALNPGPAWRGWGVTADSGIAFTLGVMALFGERASPGLKVFIAAYAVVDDILSGLILALFYPQSLQPAWLVGAAAAAGAMAVLNRWRVYAVWPYAAATLIVWLMLRQAGVSGALAGVVLAAFLPTRPSPSAAPLLAQAATALAELEQAERDLAREGEGGRVEQAPIWDWASRNLSAAASRLLSPAERVERELEPWSTYFVLPVFAFTAAGVALSGDFRAPHALGVFAGVGLGLAAGKPLGIFGLTWLATRLRLAEGPADASLAAFFGAACLCGIGDPFSIMMAQQAFADGRAASLAKLGVLAGSGAAALMGAVALALSPPAATRARLVPSGEP
jgi:NhaA family Na+:H+ antiporter